MSEERQHPLEYLSKIQDLVDLCDFVDDEDFSKATDLALKMIVKPDVPAARAAALVVQFEAYSFKFNMLAKTYMTIKKSNAGTDNNFKKNIYFGMAEQCQRMADALKYVVKELTR